MTIQLRPDSVFGTAYSDAVFGSNILFDRDQLGADGTFDDKVELLAIDQIRYPGGAITERLFDIGNPDATERFDPERGEVVELLPFSEFMAYAEANDIGVTIVVPTCACLSSGRDANGDRFPITDVEELRGFIRDTLDGVYGSPRIDAFEIGNEYWGSGEMTSVEYGRVAGERALLLREELDAHPNAEQFADTRILIQDGHNFGSANLSDKYADLPDGASQLAALEQDYGIELGDEALYPNGSVAWAYVANELIQAELDPEEIAAIDGLVVHLYSTQTDNSRDFPFRIIEQSWEAETFGELDLVVTEWNQKNTTALDARQDYGLVQAHEMLNIVEVFAEYGVDAAHVWPLQQNTASSLARDEGDPALKVPGEMFRMMSESLPGTRPIELEGARGGETELSQGGLDAHAFASNEKLVLYFVSTDEGGFSGDIGFEALVNGYDGAALRVLGVENGVNPGEANARPVVEELDPADFLEGATLDVSLDAREILEVVLSEPDFTPEMQAALAQGASDDSDLGDPGDGVDAGDGGLDIPIFQPDTPPPEEPGSDAPDSPGSDGDDDMGDMLGFGLLAALLAGLPLLLLLGM